MFCRQDPGLLKIGSSILLFLCFVEHLSTLECITDGLWYASLTSEIWNPRLLIYSHLLESAYRVMLQVVSVLNLLAGLLIQWLTVPVTS
jgi:hypothetical protein